jgi:hypothetical protein
MATPKTFAQATALLAARLAALDAAGAGGFEGLTRDLLAHVTGQTFRIAKSGPQDGTDVRSASVNTLQIGLEAKKYGQTTTLPLDALKAKLQEAAAQSDAVDLWVLAASREISSTNVRALEKTGEAEGVKVLILDWSKKSGALPRLAALCAMAPEVMVIAFPKDVEVAAALPLIVAHSSYPALERALRDELAGADIGFSAATTSLDTWMRDTLASQVKAQQRLHGFNDLLAPSTKLAHRTGVLEALDAWWAQPSPPPAVLLGDEGRGKTWAALAWWERLNQQEQGAPLILFAPANLVAGTDVEVLLAKLLYERTRIRDETFWVNRLRLWSRTPKRPPPILLVIDGLDQNWLYTRWTDLLQPLFDADRWGGLFAVLLTCRPDHWRELEGLQGLTPSVTQIPVGDFSDPELDEFLSLQGSSRSSFSAPLLALMKVPRLSLLAFQRRAELANSGDVTPERLIYEDWKARLGRRRGLKFDDEEFQDLIVDLGRKLRDAPDDLTVSRRQMLDQMTRDSGRPTADLQGALSEIVDGDWLKRTEKTHFFKVDRDRTPFALGLALAKELASASDRGAAEAILAEFMDPLKGQSLGAAMLRAATTIALLDSSVPKVSRRTLLERWLNEQNFGSVDFEAMWRVVGADMELFLDLAEEHWLARGRGGRFSEILIKAAVNTFQFPAVAKTLTQRLSTWLSWVWLDRHKGQIGLKGDDPQVQQARMQANLKAYLADGALAASFGTPKLVTHAHPDWVQTHAFGLLSFLPRAPFVPAIVAWALGRAIMGAAVQFEDLAWTIRLNVEDPEETRLAFQDQITALEATSDPFCLAAASWLLEALADTVSEQRAVTLRALASTKLGAPVYPGQVMSSPRRDVQLDPAETPDVSKPVPSIVAAELWRSRFQRTESDLNFDKARKRWAREHPDRLAATLSAGATSVEGRSEDQILALAAHVEEYATALDEPGRAKLSQAMKIGLDRLSQKAVELRNARLLLEVWGKPALEQFQILANVTVDGPVDKSALVAFLRPKPADYPAIFKLFDHSPSKVVTWTLLKALDRVGHREQLESWDGLAALIFDVDLDVRHAAMELAVGSKNKGATTALAKSDWSADTTAHLTERAYGSLLLGRDLAVDRTRLDPEACSGWLRADPDNPEALKAYHAFVRAAVEGMTTPGERTVPGNWAPHGEALDILLQKDGAAFLSWFKPWFAEHRGATSGLFETFPLIEICEALWGYAPTEGIDVWRGLIEEMDQGIISRDDLPLMPFSAPESPEALIAVDELIVRADTDRDLFDIARSAMREDKIDWLVSAIDRVLSGNLTEAAAVAKAVTLLGFLEVTDATEAIWARFQAPTQGWLKVAYDFAKADFAAVGIAAHWFNQFEKATGVAEMIAAYELFLAAADMRSYRWFKRLSLDDDDHAAFARRRHWNLNSERLEQSAKAKRDGLKSTLVRVSTATSTHSPWLG